MWIIDLFIFQFLVDKIKIKMSNNGTYILNLEQIQIIENANRVTSFFLVL